MAVIEGYTFAIDMQDRGVSATLRQVKAEAKAMKAAMRSGFETIQSGEGTLAAYNYKLVESQRQIDTYRLAIERLQASNEKLNNSRDKNGELSEKDATAYAKNARQIENYKRQINSLKMGMEESRKVIDQYNSGLIQSRTATANLHSVTQSYLSVLKEEQGVFSSNRTKASLLKNELSALERQSRLETESARLMTNNLKSMQAEYDSNATGLRRLNNERAQARRQLDLEIASNGKATERAKSLQANYDKLNSQINNLKSAQSGLAHSMSVSTDELAKQSVKANEASAKVAKLREEARSANPTGIRRIGSALDSVSAKASKATEHTRAFLTSARSSFAGVGIVAGVATAGIGKTVQMAAQLQQQWIDIKNLLVTGGESATIVTRNLSQMQRDATKYSKLYGISQHDIADQYTELVKRGYSSEASLGAMKDMLEATRATGDDFNDVVKNSASVLDAFGLRTSNTTQMLKNTHRVVNSMAYAADMTATNFQDMGIGMSYVSASAAQAGFTVEQTASALGELSNAGIEGSSAGTGLRKTINSLLSPTKSAYEALQKYGMSIDDFRTKSGKLKNVDEIFKIINQHTAKLGKADRGAFFKAVFGTTGMQAAEVLAQSAGGLKKNDDQLSQLIKHTKEAEKGNGYVHQLAQKNMASTKMRVKQLEMTMQDMAINIGNKLLPSVNKVAQGISRWAASKEGQQSIAQFSDSVASLGEAVANHATSIMSFLGGFSSGLLDVANVTGKAVSGIGKLVSFVTGNKISSNGFARGLGVVAGVLTGITISFKLIHTLSSGIRAISQDVSGLFSRQNGELTTQNGLMREYIRLQERSLEIQEAQARQQGVLPEAPIEKGGAKPTELSTGGVASRTTSTVEKDMEAVGAKSGSRFTSAFLRGSSRLTRGVVGLILPSGFIDIGARAGRFLGSGILSATRLVFTKSKNALSTIFVRPFQTLGKSAGETFAKAWPVFVESSMGKDVSRIGSLMSNGFKSTLSKISPIGSLIGRWVVPESWRSAGVKAAQSFANGLKQAKNIRLNPKIWFSGVEAGARETGVSAGKGLIENLTRTASATSRLAQFGMGLAKKIGDPLIIAFGAIDVMRAWNTSNSKNRAANVGKSLGNTAGSMAGMVAGAKLGGTLGWLAPGIGNAVGAVLGAVVGGVMGSKIGKALGPLGASFAHTISNGIKHHRWDWSGVAKSWKDLWKGLGNWWDQLIGKKTSKKPETTEKTFKSAGNVQYSKEDVANLKDMTSAVKKYKSALQGLKATVRNNDPSKEMNSMLSRLQKSVSGWNKLAKPIRSIGDAFKYLATFSKSMAKRDAFAALNKDLPKLASVVKKYGKSIVTNINNLGKSLGKNKLAKPLETLDKEVKTASKNWKTLATPVKTASKAFDLMAKSVKNLIGKKAGFTALDSDVKNLTKTLKNNKWGKLISEQADIANDAMAGKKSGFVNKFNSQTRSMTKSLRDFSRTFKSGWRNAWNNLDDPVNSGLDKADTAEYHNLNSIQSRRSKFQTAFLKSWKSWISDVTKSFKNGFDKLPGYAGDAMKSIVSKMNKGISSINSVISDFGGDKKLSSIKYADGTRGGHPGGNMLINDSVRPHWKELVKFPGKPWQMFNERNVFIPNAPKGTRVLSGENTHRVMSAIGVKRYADGSDDEEMIEKMIKNPLGTLKGIFFKATNFNGSPVITDFGTALADGFLNAIKDKMKELAKDAEDANSPAGTMSMSAFRKIAKRAAKLMGKSLSATDIKHLYWQAFTESSVNPAQNGGYDDHDGTGLPIGLFQFKRGTWNAAASHLPRNHHNIHSALDQIMAVLADANWRSDFPPIGVKRGWSPSGYANGGIIAKHQMIEVGEGNRLESIMPWDLSKRPQALNIMNQTLDHMENDGGGTGNIRRVNEASDNKFKDNVIALLGQIAGLNKQQIDAILTIDTNSMSSRRKRSRFYNDYGQDTRLANYMRP